MTFVSKDPATHFSAKATPVDSPVVSRVNALYRSVGKRFLDLSLVILSAPFVVPVVLLLALCVWLQGGKPFYSQPRLGRNGDQYRIWKLRTMVHNAEDALQRHLAENEEAHAEWAHTQKLVDDPRITRMGRILRKTSLDELPQLWNVFLGDMSLVGPRPMMPEQADLYSGTSYYKMRPGITGLWQVSARNNSSFQARAGFDAIYYSSIGLGTDLRTLLSTVRVVLKATGH